MPIPFHCIECDKPIPGADKPFCDKCLAKAPKNKLKIIIRKGIKNARK